MRISLIVAMQRNRIIGRGGELPWHLSADLRRFKRLTMGHHIIMGRKTFESIGRLLPGRTSVVVTRQLGYSAPGALVAHNLSQALEACGGDDEAFVIGGAEVYREALPLADRIYLTEVQADVPGDARFPDFDRSAWSVVEHNEHPADEHNEHPHSYLVLDRAC